LALGDARGFDDLERAIELGDLHTRPETRVRGYVNAAGSCYRAGRFDQARRHVAAGLRIAADGAFEAGRYRLLLTSAGIAASAGDWDRAISELRQLASGPGDAGIMAPLARSLLARRGDPAAGVVLDEALADPVAAGDSYVAGPLAVARVELGWLAGGLPRVPDGVGAAVELAVAAGHTALLGELAVYLRRAGLPMDVPVGVPQPWADGVAGRWRAAAGRWEALGERYERAVELAGADDGEARGRGLRLLSDLGASATAARLGGRPR
jgi:hypothetical protein